MIRSLNLDQSFFPTPHSHIYCQIFTFHGGEMHIKLDNSPYNYKDLDKVIITSRIKNGSDLMLILLAKDALVRKGVKHIELFIPYLPYARQDRVCVGGESFSLKVFADIINAAQFDKVYMLDAHSDVGPALINNSHNISNELYVGAVLASIGKEVLFVSPDSGANKKINKLSEILGNSVVKCDKKREVATGTLSGIEVFSTDLNGMDCLIIDDICDGGRTFTGIAKELKKKNAGDIYLFVTHGIFSNGFDELNKWFTRIYSTNSIPDINGLSVTQLKIAI